MFDTDDVIVAIATPAGRGGIGVVRVSGPRAPDVARDILTVRTPLAPRQATCTHLRGSDGAAAATIDAVVATAFPAPHSYTGQHVVEISAHGSPVVLQAIVRAAMHAGARLAQPGEFTLRAFLNGKIDLVQAEAVGDLIAAVTPLQARVAFDQLEGTLTRRIAAIDGALFDLIARLEASLDFPDEGFHFVEAGELETRLKDVVCQLDTLLADATQGRAIREGATVVIAGRPNVGKSSLFNALSGYDRAIVTPVPGTTRDLITERVDLDGLAVTLVDTAGARETLDEIEREGVDRGARAREAADLVLIVIDRSEALSADDLRLLDRTRDVRRLIVANKADCPPQAATGDLRVHDVSALTGEGVAEMRRAMIAALTGEQPLREGAALSNVRHISLLQDARASLQKAIRALRVEHVPEEMLLIDLHAARQRFDEVVGVRSSDDVLRHIFEKFCIGK